MSVPVMALRLLGAENIQLSGDGGVADRKLRTFFSLRKGAMTSANDFAGTAGLDMITDRNQGDQTIASKVLFNVVARIGRKGAAPVTDERSSV